MVVHDVGVRAHRHDRRLYLNLLEDVLFWYFHDSHSPALIAIFAVESLIHCAHGSLAQLFREPVGLVRVLWFELNFSYFFVELCIRQQRIVWYLLWSLEPSHNLNHGSRVLLDIVAADIVLLKQLEHVVSQPLDTHGAVQVNLQVQLVLEVRRPE